MPALLGRIADFFLEPVDQALRQRESAYAGCDVGWRTIGVFPVEVASGELQSVLRAFTAQINGPTKKGADSRHAVSALTEDSDDLEIEQVDVLVMLAGPKADPALTALTRLSLERRDRTVILVQSGCEAELEADWRLAGVDLYLGWNEKLSYLFKVDRFAWSRQGIALKRLAQLCLQRP